MDKLEGHLPDLLSFLQHDLSDISLSIQVEEKRQSFINLLSNIKQTDRTNTSSINELETPDDITYRNFPRVLCATYSNDFIARTIQNKDNHSLNEKRKSLPCKFSTDDELLIPPPLPRSRPPSLPVFADTPCMPNSLNNGLSSPIYNNLEENINGISSEITYNNLLYERKEEENEVSDGTISWTSDQESQDEEPLPNNDEIKLPRRFSNFLSISKSDQCQMSGELFLKSKLGNDKYFCAIIGDKLLCYKTEKSTKYSECILLKDSEIIVQKKGKKNLIIINLPNNVSHQFQVKDKEIYELWIKGLGRAAKIVKRLVIENDNNSQPEESVIIYIPLDSECELEKVASVEMSGNTYDNVSKAGLDKNKSPTLYERASNFLTILKPKKCKMKPNIGLSFDPEVVICGFLNITQNTEANAKWIQKWVQVKNNQLECYEGKSEPQFEFSLSLYGANISAAAEETRRPLSFKLKKGKVILYIEALTTEEFGNWLKVLIKEAQIAELWGKQRKSPIPVPRPVLDEDNIRFSSVKERAAGFERMSHNGRDTYILPHEINPIQSGNKFTRLKSEQSEADDIYLELVDKPESLTSNPSIDSDESLQQKNVIKRLSLLVEDFQSILSTIPNMNTSENTTQQMNQLTLKKEDISEIQKYLLTMTKKAPVQNVKAVDTGAVFDDKNVIIVDKPKKIIKNEEDILDTKNNYLTYSNYYLNLSEENINKETPESPSDPKPIKGFVREKLQLFQSIDDQKS